MDNNMDFVKDAALGETQGVENGLTKLSGNENVDLSLDGLKDINVDEIFEEAVAPATPMVDTEARPKTDGGNVESVLEVENGESDVVHVTQKIEEDIAESFHDTVQSDAQPESLETGNHEDKVVISENDGLCDESKAEENEADIKEIVDSSNYVGEVDDLSHRDEVNTEAKPVDTLSENATSLRPMVTEDSKGLDADIGQDYMEEIFETPRFHDLNGGNSDPRKSDIKEYIHATADNQDDNEGSDIGSTNPENGTLHLVTANETLKNDDTGTVDVCVEQSGMTSSAPEDAIEVKASENDSQPEPMSNMLHIPEQNVVRSESGPQSVSTSNGDTNHNDEKNENVKEPITILGSGYQQEKEDNLANQFLEFKGDQVVEEEETLSTSTGNRKDVDEAILKEPVLENIELQKTNAHIVDKDENSSIEAANTTSTSEIKESNEMETNLSRVIENGTASPEVAEVEKPHLESLESSTECSKSYKEMLLHKKVEISTPLDPKESVKDDMKEPHVSENKEREVASVLPPPGNSSTSTAYPPVSEHVAKEKEIKPTREISSSANSRTTTSSPAGLGLSPLPQPTHSSSGTTTSSPAGLGLSPLPQPTHNSSGNRENVSRSAVATPATNTTSAPPSRPAGLGRAAPLLEPATRVAQQPRVNGAATPTPNNQLVEDQNGDAAEEYDETREKLQMIRVKFLRLAHRLGQTPHNVVVAQVLYRLGLAEQLRGRSGGRVGAFSFDRASAMAEQLEAAGQEPLDFTCTIMVLGKSGVGKSATINSIFDEVMFGTDAFQLGTKKVQDIVGTVQGIRVRVIDTPGLLPSWSDQRQNEKILNSVKRFIKKTPPDIVLYLDRLDMQGRDFGETPLLRTITEIFGPSIWFNAIVVLTHAASAPPEGPNGTTTSYDMFVTQRSHVVQQAIRQAAGDMRLMNPVSLVENHSACRTNRAGQRVLPNGQVWKPHLLLLSFASKILAEANTLLKLQDSPPGRPFASRTRSPPLPYLLSTLLQSRPEVKLPSEQFGDDDDALGDDVDDSSDLEEYDNEYDNLPPFKPLTKAQLEKLPKSQRKAYHEELEYREKLFAKKQLKEEKSRRKMMKKMQEALKGLPTEYGENAEEDSSGAASVPVAMPDLALPASFDSDNPTHRYRSLDSNPWLVRAVLEPNGWDHDIGYDGINVERLFVVKDKIPISFSGHVSKDKKDANLQMEVASSVKHGKGKATSLGFDMQSVGKDMAYTMRSETKFSNRRINKASAGFSATLMGDVLTGGIKVEDKLLIGRRGQLVVSGGGIYGRGDVAYGGSLEATLRDKDHPLGRFLSTLAVSVMDWHGDLAIGCNSQTQIPLGRFSNLIARFSVNNHGSGQVSLRVNSSEQLQIVLFGLIPLVKKFLGNDRSG